MIEGFYIFFFCLLFIPLPLDSSSLDLFSLLKARPRRRGLESSIVIVVPDVIWEVILALPPGCSMLGFVGIEELVLGLIIIFLLLNHPP